ncbi:MAG: Hpt domain-containing protein [Desulfovibrionaceae bacterium]|nr:Hpt domain-containing protein [Desulfovibrionaceae bacterium]
MSHDPTAPAKGLPVLDLDGACEFLELSRAEIMLLVPQAMIEIRDKFERIHPALRAEAFADAARYAHTIKSVAASIGAEAVRQCAETLELHAKTAAPDNCPQLAEALQGEIARLTQAVAALPQ